MDDGTQGGDSRAATATADAPASAPATPAPASQPGGPAQQWAATAQPETQSPDMGGAQLPKQDDQQQFQAPPVVLTPVKKGGILGVIDDIAGALVGKTRPELATDQDGNKYIKTQTLTRGQQWLRIAGEGLVGAAAGMAAGKGAGNEGKAAFAGVQQGQQMAAQQEQNAKEMTDEVRQQKLDNANNQMLQMKMAENAWDFANKKVKATDDDIKFNNDMEDRLVKDGGKVIGTAAHPGDIAEILKVQPDVMEQMVKKQTIRILPNIDENGNHVGIKAIIMPSGYHNEVLPAGQTGHSFNPITGKVEEFKYSDPVTAGERDAHDAAAVTAKQAFDEKQRQADKAAADLAHTRQETATSAAEQKEVPSKIAEQTANANKANSEAAAAKGKGGDASDPALIKMIGTGQMPAGRLSYLLARNPALTAAVADAYPGFDGSKVEAYTRAYADFTSGHTSQELLSGGTALEHLAELKDLNTIQSHNPLSAAYTAYQNKADTVATELAKFYGDSTIPAIAAIKSTLTSQLPGKRDAAITTQAGSMADRMDNYAQKWSNAAPSEAYEAQMPGISPKAKAAWATLDPKYQSRTAAGIFGKTPAAAPQQQPAAVIVQQSPSTGQFRHSVDGGKTWIPGQPQ